MLYPKIFPPLFISRDSFKASQIFKTLKGWLVKMLLLSQRPATRVWSFSSKFGLKRYQVASMVPLRSLIRFMSSFKSCITSFLNQWLRWLKINYIGQKVNYGQHTIKPQYFWSTSTFWGDVHHLVKGWSWFPKESSQIIKNQNLPN